MPDLVNRMIYKFQSQKLEEDDTGVLMYLMTEMWPEILQHDDCGSNRTRKKSLNHADEQDIST